MLNIGIFTEGNLSLPYNNIPEKFFTAVTEAVLKHTDTGNVSVSIILTDNEFIRTLNSDYRGKDTATDVISFAYRDEPFPVIENVAEELGDVYISLEKASEQAAEYEVTFTDELKRLIIHGVLHLLGYDHEKSDEENERMTSLESEIFSIIDI
jgi:probable rRNA maturation factor